MTKDHKRNITPMQESRQKISEKKYQSLKVVLEDLIHNQEEITIPRIIQLSGLSKSYLYKNERVKELIEDAKTRNIDGYRSKKTDLNVNLEMNKSDMLLQYEEVKRKLQDSYILQYQLLQNENYRLLKEIELKEQEVNRLQSRSEIQIHLIPEIADEDNILWLQIRDTETGQVLIVPVVDRYIEGLNIGKYELSSENKSLSLLNSIPGITFEKEEDFYLLNIIDEPTENTIIEIIIN